ncbi:MAG: UvrD-helicase domain-containing protein, partial [Rhodocyclaceae bacterium]|nr:UvrD-helicase domain-containing protein [Rhodocyclaceae bacterium]
IAALYLRLILGHGTEKTAFRGGNTPLVPQDILVLTFTRAATRELTKRIRARLTQAARVFRGEIDAPQDDPFLCDLLAEYRAQGETATQQAAWRLALAAEAMDEAAVHTIDAWCQRMLREHALDSGQPFDDEFGDDEAALRQEAVRDYWRQQVYALDKAVFAAFAAIWGDVEQLEQALETLHDAHLPQAVGLAGQTLAALLAPLAQANGQLQTCIHGADWRENAQQMRDWLDGGTWNGNKIRPALYNGWLAKLVAWLDAPKDKFPLSEAACRNLSPDGLRAAWKGAGECPTPPAGFDQFAALVAALAARDAAQQETASRVRLHAAVQVQARLEALKRQRHTFGFFDALRRLNNALHDAERGARLRQRILAQTPVALIDEFQDTSPEQYAIFNTLYRTQDDDPDTALLLIGDPKQSIYAFRGADIYAYLDARRATAGRHYRLNTNYRSTAAMVEAVNRWFAQGEEAREAGAFRFRAGAENPLPFFPVDARGLRETLRTRTGDVPPCTLACWQGEALSKEDCRERFAEHCAAQIVAWLNDEGCGFYDDETGAFRRLRPADIAILVHDFREAEAMRRALRVRDLPSVYLSERES